MSKTDKLLAKLKNETISKSELETLLKKLGWLPRSGSGSHIHWLKDGVRITLATHNKHVPRYQLKQVKGYLEVK